MKKHEFLGKRGYYGSRILEEDNLKVRNLNKIIDKYNLNINSVNTHNEQLELGLELKNEINKVIK